MSRSSHETLNPSFAEGVPFARSRFSRWKRGAAVLAAATTVVATAGVIAPLAAHAAAITVSVPGQTRAVPIVPFTDTQDVVTLGGLSNATSSDTALFTQSKTGQATGYTNYSPLYTYTASSDSTATFTPASSQPFDLVPTALPPGYYDIEVDNAISGNSEGSCVACIFVTGGTPTITGLSQTAVAAGATIGTSSGTSLTASTSQFAVKGTNFNHDATVTSDNAGITFTPQVNGTTYTDESASGLTVRYGQLKVASTVKPGTYHLTVTDGDGGTATTTITVDPPLVITSIYPKTVGNGDTNRLVTVVGSGISSTTKFATSVVNPSRLESASGITVAVKAINSTGTQAVLAFTVPTNEEAASDTGSVSNGVRSESLGATNPDSGAASIALPVNGASPTISSVVNAANVSQVTPGSGSQTLTITGANFVTGSTVAFLDATGKAVPGITVGTVTYNSATSLTAAVTIGSTAVTQIDAPTVINTDGGTGTCATSFSGATVVPSACFQVASFVISGNEPPIDNSSTANKAVLFKGTGFGPTSTFTAQLVADPAIAGQPAIPSGTCTTDPASTPAASSVSCTFPKTVLAAPVTYDVLFTRTTGSVVDSDTDPGVISITNPGKPTTTSLSPTVITGADLARTLTLTGTNFANGAVVKSSNAAFTLGTSTVTSATSLTVPVTLPRGTASGTGTFTVTNGDSGVSAASGAITIGTEPTVSVPAPPATYTIGNAGFLVQATLDNTATGAATLPNEQLGLALSGLTGLTPSQVTATYNNVAVTPIMVGSTVVIPSTVITATAAKTTGNFLVRLVPGASSGNLNITPSVGDALGTASYPSTTTPDIQAAGTSFAVAVAGPAPTLTSSAFPSQLVVGDPAASQTVTVTNNSGTRINEGQLDIAVTGPAGLAPGQLQVTSSTAAASPVTLTLNNGAYKGVLTPAQIIQSGTTLTSTVTVALATGAPLGAYSVVTTLDETDQNGVLDGKTLAGPLTQSEQGVSVPSVPTALVLTPGDGSLVVAFGAPASDGGDGPLTYKITALASGAPQVVVTATTSPVVLTGLTNGAAYTVFVQAENALNRFGSLVSAVGTPVAAATLSGSRAVSASLSKAFAPLGTRVTMTGKLTIGGLGVPGAPVTIQTTYSDGKVVTLGTVVTKADGTYSYTFTPLYNGYLVALSGTAVSKPVGSRVIVTFTRLTVTHSGNRIKVIASTAPGFVTSSKRLERAQVLLVNGSGKILKVLAIVNAANRHSSPGQAHGVNDVTYTGTLPAGSYRIAVKIIGTPVNTGAQSGSKSFSIA